MKKQDKDLLLLVVIGLVILYFLTRKNGGKTIDVSYDFLIGAYADYINNPGNLTYEGMPMFKWLALNTTDFPTVAAQYKATFKTTLAYDLIARLGDDLPEYVQIMYDTNQTAISE